MGEILNYLRGVAKEFKEQVDQGKRYIVIIDAGNVREVAAKIKELGSETYLATITAVDLIEEGTIQLNYCFWSQEEKALIVLRVNLPRESPRIQTISDIIPGACNAEMEAYDLMGVYFEGNPSLKRSFLAPEEVAKQGVFPLRKDFKG
ncbi:MAG: NADH-quinone oxidoreductase subunit C [Desulfurococcales archaeon]|nr:NADH-quinone oxidoreductase subunit C [Desulfurococcales archaeon]